MSNKPKCPNHNCELNDIDWNHGKGICPVSGAEFTFTAKGGIMKHDKFGKQLKQFKVVGDD